MYRSFLRLGLTFLEPLSILFAMCRLMFRLSTWSSSGSTFILSQLRVSGFRGRLALVFKVRAKGMRIQTCHFWKP